MEAGLNDVEMEGTLGIVAPAETPKEVISQLSTWLTTALRTPAMHAKLTSQGLNSVGMCGADFRDSSKTI